jgi:LmbE family N-acetylglucosaminyl deacetylase
LRTTAGLLLAFTFAIFGCAGLAQNSSPSAYPKTAWPEPGGYSGPELPQDQGAVALWQELQKLQTTARIMQVTAHHDDEDGGMLTLEARGHGATVMLFSFTRGDGGQNKFGTETAEDLGILRTLELLAADQYYGVEQGFSRVVDFGFSKTAEETFSKWGGHDAALGDLVLAIRKFRPDILIARFSGTSRDGHGHHQASAILAIEAFRAAADPNRFPEQIKAGALPWQAKKLYSDNLPRQRDATVADQDYTVAFDTGEYTPVLGMSYAQFGLEGLAHQTSQGVGGLRVPPGHRYSYYKLLDSALPGKPPGHEKDFTDGIDTSLAALANGIANEHARSNLQQTLASISQHATEATRSFSIQNTSACAPALLVGLDEARKLLVWTAAAPSGAAQLTLDEMNRVLPAIRTKVEQFQRAANLALGVRLEASVDPPGPAPAPSPFPRLEQSLTLAVPGQVLTVTARLFNRGHTSIDAYEIRLDVPQTWETSALKQATGGIGANENGAVQFQLKVPENAPLTRPFWSRKDPENDNIYTNQPPQFATLPLPPYPVHVTATYRTPSGIGEAHATVMVKFIDPTNGQSQRPLSVGPPISVLTSEPIVAVPAGGRRPIQISVNVRSNVQQPVNATLRLELPAGWKAEPAAVPVALANEGDTRNYTFEITSPQLREGTYEVSARADYNGKQYREGFRIIGRPDLGSFYSYRPAETKIRAIDVAVPANRVGYIVGAGDEIPAVLAGLGINIRYITPQELASGDLDRYDTIVVGIRAYDVRTDVREQNRRLLDFVQRGGTLIVQYNASVGIFNEGHYTPYPASLSNARVSVEEQPVEILQPQSPVFNAPNKIGARDFDGWVQERGLYFMSQWDAQFTPLLESHDPGEAPQKGGLLMARYGKGVYIYSAYAYFRQLPAAVPGAVRLFVNLLAAGHENSLSPAK